MNCWAPHSTLPAASHRLLSNDKYCSEHCLHAASVHYCLVLRAFLIVHARAAGALMALFVGFSTIISNYAVGGILIAFFVSSSLLTRVSASMKRRIDAEFKEGGQRDWKQVACNGLVPSITALAYGVHTGFMQGPFLGGFDSSRPSACLDTRAPACCV
jgi:uncharacterized membrane protein